MSDDLSAPGGRALKLAFILDPLPELKAYKDSSVAMMRAAQINGHTVFAIDSATLAWQNAGGVFATARQLQLRPDDDDWYRADEQNSRPLNDFDAVIMRKDPPFDSEYLTATWLLERAEADGVRVFNRPRALRDHSEKVAISEFPQFTPTTLIAREPERLQRFIDEQGDVILKPLDGMGGSQIFRVRRDDPNRNVIIETLTREDFEAIFPPPVTVSFTRTTRRSPGVTVRSIQPRSTNVCTVFDIEGSETCCLAASSLMLCGRSTSMPRICTCVGSAR